MPEEMIEVRIEASQKVRYSQVKKIPKSLLDKYERMCEGAIRDEDFNREFEHLLDYEIADSDELQDLTIELHRG